MVGDTNDDDVLDVVVGAPGWESEDGDSIGLITFFHMKKNGAWKSYRIYYGDTFGYGEGSYFGQSIATVRDLNNDTYFELAVGAPGTEGGGSIMLLHMEDEGMVGNYTMLNASTLDFSDEGSLGFSMASGALRNVTSYDLVTGDPSIDNYDGRVMFIQFDTLNDRKVASSWNVSAAQFGLGGMGAWFGYSVAVMPDFDGDGENEVIVGMPYHDDQRGAIMILYMGAGSRSVKRSVMLTQGNISSVLSGNPRFGTAMTFVGLRNESTASFFVAVGATHDKSIQKKAGAIIVMEIAPNGTVLSDYKISDLSNTPAWNGGRSITTKSRFLGASLAGVQDLNRDGYEDIFAGAPGSGCCGAFYELFMTSSRDASAAQYDDDYSSTPAPTVNYIYSGEVTSTLPLASVIVLIVAVWSCCTCSYMVYKLRMRQLEANADGQPPGMARLQRRGLTQAEIDSFPVTAYGLSAAPRPSAEVGDGTTEGDSALERQAPADLSSDSLFDEEGDTCAICLTEFKEGDRVKSVPCGHMYHPECIDTWLRNAPKCPLCQQHVLSWNNDTAAVTVTDMTTPLGGEDASVGEGSEGANANVPGSIFEMTLIGGTGRSGGSAASDGEALDVGGSGSNGGGGGRGVALGRGGNGAAPCLSPSSAAPRHRGGGAAEAEFMPVPNTRVHANLPSSQVGVESVTLFGSGGTSGSSGATDGISTQVEMDEDNPPGQSESTAMMRAPSRADGAETTVL
mmetsp:Transcript_76705/g.220166  ORF Transcript_76705/g.220166 Transcript_76705/m.220166 type:complete len:735 (+) Transcript_76705:650-2854(+)